MDKNFGDFMGKMDKDFGDFMGKVVDQILNKKTDKSKWNQVGKLSPTDMGLMRSHHAKADMTSQKANLLMKKLEAIKAQADADSSEWWLHLKETYSLSDGNLTIEKDGRILMEPKTKQEKKNEIRREN